MCFYILMKASHNGPKGPSLLLSLSADFRKAAIENNNDLTIQVQFLNIFNCHDDLNESRSDIPIQF